MPEPGETHLSDDVDADADGEIDAEVERPRWGVLMLVAFGGLVVCTNIANAVWVEWINDDPERVIALSSRNRFLALAVGADVSPVAFVVISGLRLGLAFTVCHMLGRAYRQDAYRFFVRFLGLSRQNVDQMEDGFAKAQWVLIPFFIGSNIVAVISGVERTPWRRLVVLFLIGLAGRLALVWWLANTFEDQLDDVLDFVAKYQWWFLIGSIAIVVLANWRNLRRGSGASRR